MESVCEMASGQVRPGDRSTPGGSGGRPFACGGSAVASVSFVKGASWDGCCEDMASFLLLPD